MLHRATALLFSPAVLWCIVAVGSVAMTLADEDPWRALDRRTSEVTGASTCARCHPSEHQTWHASFHRTMTQHAVGDAVLAPFAGESLGYLGFIATMDRSPTGRPQMTVRSAQDPDAPPLLQAEVDLTVGSHRYQQYVARIDGGGGPEERWRLPLAWHMGERRWIHMNGAFLTPDGTNGSAEDYLRHLSRWNDNCVFCHNTEPVPGLTEDGVFRTTLGEIGIACEACHGPASLHVERHERPLRRILALGPAGADGSITHPGRLSPGLAAGICGRCHGQRIASDVGHVLAHGDGFLPGTDLSQVSRPVVADARLQQDPDGARPFAPRFWPEGTPRLSAYEYQGLLLSPCHQQGQGMDCGDCHTMHGSEPDMQLRSDFDIEAACEGCHRRTELGVQHGGHTRVDCQGCHMPRITYGLLEGMMSHRVTVPDPGRWVGRDDMPDACTQCHVDRDRMWAAEAMGQLGLSGSAPAKPAPSEAWGSRVGVDLVGGDPVQRTLAAHALARPEATGSVRTRMAWLVDGLEDEYPAVRWFAWRGIVELATTTGHAPVLATIGGFDPLADPLPRLEVVARLREILGSSPIAARPQRWESLLLARDGRAIEIGE